MNLINDAWIPVRRKNGEKIKIAPWQITEGIGTDNEIMELAAVRPDFNGALIQFLIGLLQTTCAPKGTGDWRQWLNNPPNPGVLKDKFIPISYAFNLDGDGPRFMQDLTIESEDGKTKEDTEKLLIDAPGDQTLKQNRDLFIKRRRADKLCFACAAKALLTLQINAPSGGKGHRVGLRGGGPINTIILGDTLWQTLWCNALSENEFAVFGTLSKSVDSDKFPWLAQARTSENDRMTTSQDVHPAQVYWPMPRRIRLNFTGNRDDCGLCHENGGLVETYFTKPYGVKYDGFIHPLTPTYKKGNSILSVHQHEAVGYRNWLGLVQSTTDGKEPARIINMAINRRMTSFRLWAFGYDMDNMKACCWYEGVMPVIVVDDEQKQKIYGEQISHLITAANEVSNLVSKAVTKAINAKMFAIVQQRFWQETESEFYRLIALLRDEIAQDRDGLEVRQAWHKYLVRKAEDIFNDLSQADMIEMVRAGRVAKARNELMMNLYGRKLKQEILGLPT